MPVFSPVLIGNRLPYQLPEPQQFDSNSWLQVSAFNNFAAGITSNNLLYAWGVNNVYQVGDGTTQNKSLPVQISASSFMQVSAGFDHSGAITTENRLFVWGNQPSIQTLTVNQSWTSINNGGDHFLAIRNDGALFAWGFNDRGQIGDNSTLNKSSPVQLGTSSWSQVSAGYYNSAALTTTGQLFVWGLNSAGQLGQNNLISRSSPIQVTAAGVSSWIAVTSGNQYYFAIDSTNRLFGWGLNNLYQLGLGDQMNTGWRSNPVQIGTSSWIAVSAGGLGDHTTGIDVNGNLYIWGNFNSVFAPIPTTIYSWTQLSAGGQHTSGIRNDNTLWVWGLNTSGQLGQQNTTLARSSPVQITSSSFTTVSSKFSHGAAIRSDNALLIWGFNAGGGLGLGTTVNRSSPVVVSNALDTSSYAYTMFNVNSVYDTTLVPIAGSVSGVFDGTSFLTVDNAPQLVFGTNNFTIEFWVYLTNTSVVLLMDFRPASTNGLYPAIYTTSSTFRLFVNGLDRITSSTYTINTWYHLAIVRISSTTTMYVNGVAAGIYVDSNSYLCPAARPIIGASGFSLGSNAMTGYLSNIRITNGVGVYTNTFTVPTSILTATQSSGVNINAITAGQTVFLTYTTFAASITATNYSSVATGTSNTAAVRNDNTIWIWGDNSSGQLGNLDLISRSNPTQLGNLFQLVDSSLNNFPISNFGTSFSTTNVPSLTGGPVSGVFDTTGYIVASSTIYTFGTGVWTAECWVRFDDLSTTRSIFGLAVSGTNGAFLSRNSNNGFTISSGDPPNFANATSTASASNLITSTSVWYHIAWTRSGATSSVYLDGVAVINAGAIRSPFATTPTNIYVGIGFGVTNGNYSPLTPSFFGKISNVRVTWGKQVYTGTFTVPTAVLTTSQSAGVNISAISPSDVALLTYTTTSSFINAFPSSWSSVDAGDRFFVAKKPDGTLWAWGLNTSGQVGVASINNRSSPAVVASGSWLQFSVGFDHTLAIRADNTLWTWGNFNAIGLVTEVQSWSTVAAGGQNSLAIKSDGTLWGWGANAQGQVGDFTTVLKNSPVNIAAASWSGLGVGNSSSFAIDTVGALYAWGWNSSGQLGIGNSLNRSSPTQITFSGSWTLVKPGFDHVEAIDTLGRLYAWGNFTTGQTGVQIFTTDSWVAIANGLALRADNTLWSWGSNPGDGTTIVRSSPIQIGTNEWTSIALTYQSTFAKAAIKIDNTLYMWGDNSNGQLGLNDTINRSSPVQVTGSWLQVSTQLSNTAAINSSNVIFTWGNNSAGQLGDNSTINKSSPVLLASPFNTSNWTTVSVGYSHIAAIRSDGALYLWGFNNRGQLGNNNPGVSRSNPVLTALTTSSFVAISAGASHNIAIRAIDRALFGWGAPWGNGTAPSGNNISAPQQIGTSSWASVAAGADSSYAITMTGQLWAWGTNANGLIAQNINFANFNAASVPIQLGSSTNFLRAMPAAAITSANTAFVWGPENSAFNNTTLTYSSLVQVGSKLTAQFYSPQQVGSSSWTSVESGSSFTVAIDANNLLYGWGLNTSGQLGDRTTLNRSSPTLLNSSSWIAIAAEFDHVLAIRSDTTLWTWGNSTAIGLVTYPQSWSQISAGWSHTLGIRSDGALFTWGLNSSGQLGTGNLTDRASPTLLGFNFGLTTNFIGASSWSQISAGNNFSLAIDVNNRMFAWGLNTSFQLGDGYNISKSLPVQIGYSIVDQSTYGNVLRSYGQFVERGVIPFNNSISIQCNPSLVYGIEYAYRSNIAVWFDADYCMECWVFPITFTVENNRPLLISHGFPWAGIANYWSFGFDINGSLTFYYFNGGGVTVSGGGGASLNTWQHISMTYTNSTGVIRLYHNGLLVGFSTKQGTPQTDTRYELNIGALSGVAFNGYISNIRIVKGNVVYTGEFNPPTSPLTAIQSAGPNINAIIAGQTSLLVLTSPASVTSLSWTSISAGGDHALAVASNGNLFSWGNNDNGQAGRFNAAQSWSFIAANSTALGFSAIRNDGLLFVWGANDQSQLGLGDILARSSPVQLGVNSWTSVSIGRHHALAIRNDGTLWAWGYNNFGQLGVNNLVSQGSPVQITAIAGSWSSVTAGWIQSYGITTTGNLYAWGYNAFGLLGLGDIISRSVPTQITTPSASWIQVAAGASAVAAITSTNIIYTWGLNSSGQLGNNTVVSRSSPTLLAAPFNTSNFTAVAVNQNHMLGLLNNGALYAWGLNDVGQLGNNTTINRSNPTLVVASNSWTLITVTGNSSTNAASLAIATNGSLWAWGGNATGMLGDSTVVNKSSPIQIGTSSWSLITAGDQSVLARRLDNTIFAWGLGSSGQIGNNVAINVSSPVQIGNLPDMNRWSPVQVGNSSWSLASAGVSFSSGIDSVGGLYGWGLNTSRQVGDNTTVSKFSPVVIASGSWTKVDAGASHSLAIRNDGSLWGWGIGSALNINNVTPFSWSQLANSSGNTNNVLAIRNDGSLWGWGNNGAGSLGDNSGVSKSSPVLIDSGSWTSVSVGANHSAAIKQGGTLFIWGLNSSGQLGLTDVVSRSNPTQLDSNSWSSVSTGFNATAAIRGNQLYVWGDNSNGQLGINSVSLRSSPVQIAGSWTAVALGTQQQTLALNYLNDLFGWGYNGEFNLGNNSNVSRSSPIQISSYTKFTTLRSGERHSIAIDTNNKVWIWGNQDMLQTDVNSWTQIAYGESHAIALRSDGRMFGWGQNVYGQLGTNDSVNKSSPVLVGLNPSSTSWVSVFATAYSSYGITSLGTLYAWGEGSTGAIGDGTTISRSNPTVVFSGDTKFLGLQTGAFLDTTDIHRVNPLGTTIPVINMVQGGYNGYSVSFGGTGYLTVPLIGANFFNIPAATNWSFECFIFLSALPTAGNVYVVASRNWTYPTTGPTWGFSITSAGVLQWNYAFTGVAAQVLIQSAASAITTSSWIHLAFVKNTSNLASMYINGVLSTSATDANAMTSATGDLFIGVASNLAAASFFNGFISDVRIVTGVAVYTGAFTTPTRPLTITQSSGVNISALAGGIMSQVTGGVQYAMALTTTGKLYTWGTGSSGQLGNNSTINRSSPVIVTANGASFVSISSGNNYSAAVDSNGALYTWGLQNAFTLVLGTGQSNAVTSRSTPVQIAPTISWTTVSLGYSHGAAIDSNSRLYLWGLGTATNLTTQTVSWTQIAVGEGGSVSTETHALAIRSDGLLYSWGNNTFGQLGTFDQGVRSSPTLVAGAFGVPGSWYGSWTNITAGAGHSLGVNSDGRVYTWGQNNNGQLGLNDTINRSAPTLMPQALFLPTNFVEQISNSQATVNAFVSFTTDNTLYPGAITLSTTSTPNSGRATTPGNANLLMTGDFTIEFYLQSTNNGAINQTIRLPGTDGWWFRWLIAANANLEFYITQTAWNAGTPTLVATSAIAINIWYHIAVTRLGSTIRLWVNGVSVATGTYVGNVGDAANALIYADGDGTGAAGSNQNINNVRIVNGTALYTEAFVPYRGPFTRVFGSQTVVLSLTTGVTLTGTPSINRLAAGEFHSAITFNNGSLYTFGVNSAGQLGDGTTINKSSPVLIGSAANSYTQISTGLSYTIALRSNGTLWAWGLNSAYQLGDGTTLAKSSPVLIGGSNSFTSISSGANHNLAISSNFNLWTWGDVNSIILQNTDNPVSWTQITQGDAHTLGIRGDGILFTWGLNNVGQLGDGTTVNKSSPVIIGNSSYSAIGAGQSHSFAIGSNGDIFAWGLGTSGQLGDNSTISKSSPVQVGVAGLIDQSANNNTITNIGVRSSSSLTPSLLGSISGVFTPGHATVPSNITNQFGTGDFTIECWIYPTSNAATNKMIVTNWPGPSAENYQFYLNTTNRLVWQVFTQASPNIAALQININVWTHVAWVHSGSNGLLFINGTLQDTSTQTLSANGSAANVSIGSNSGIDIFPGNISNLRIVKGVAVYTGNFTVPTSILTATQSSGTNISAITGSQTSLLMLTNISSITGFNVITGGNLHSAAIDNLGRLYTWGNATSGQIGQNNIISRSNPFQLGTNSWRSVSAGISNTLAVRNDYSLWSWGLNTSFQLGDGTSITKSSPVQIGVGRSWNVISSEWDHSAAITSLGKLNVWGPAGSVLLPTAPLSWAQIASGSFNRLGIREDGSLWAWGNGGNGAIGDGTTISKSSPVLVSADWSWNAVAAGQHVNYAIRGDGGLFAWGLGINGVLGNNSTVSRSSPVQIGTNSWVSISASTNNFAIAKRADGTIWTWGLNGSGQLGDNTTITKSSPVQVGSSSWKQVQAGAGSLVVGIFNDDKLYVWGNNFQGNLGLNDTVDRSNPTQLGTESYIVISAGAGGAGIRPDNTLFVWGPNTGGKLGQNDTAARSSPVQIAGSWTQINVASRTFGIKTDGTLWSIGNNNQGQLGDGTTITKSSPVQIGTSSWTSINVGLDPGASINNIVYFWGQNQNVGTFGFGDTIDRSSPVILGSTNVNITTPYIIPTKVTNNDYSFVSVGSSFTVALATNNTAFAWGFNTSGQIGDNTVITKSSPVSIGTFSWTKLSSGSTHTVAIDSIGNAYTWGLNSSGQFGNNSTINRSSPTLLGNPGGLYTQIGIPKIINNTLSYAQIAAGASHSFVRTVDNLIYTWGNNTNGQLGTNDSLNRSNPTLISSSSPVLLSAVQIAAGRNISYLLNSANLLFTWGINGAGQIGQNDLLSRSMPTQINLTAVLDSGTAIPTLVQRNNIVVSDLSTNNLRLSYQLGAAPISFGPFTPSSSIALNLQRSGGAVNNCENVITPSIPSFNIGNYSDYTIECWVYLLDNAGLPHFYSMGISGVEARTRWYIQTNNLTFAVSSTGAWAWTSTVTGSIAGYTTNVWYHTAVVKSGNTLALYWNGTRVGFNASFTVPNGYGGSMFIGSYFNDVNNDQSYIRGYLSNFRMVAGTAIYSGTTYSVPTSPLTAVANTVMLLSSSSYVPVPPSYVQVGVGTQDTYALRPDGTLWAWGLNTYGQVGDGTTITRSSPTMLFAAGRWSSLGIGKVNTNYAISTAKGTQNRLFTWGLNTNGQSLFMDLANRSSPTQVSLSKMMQIPAPVRPDTSFNFVAAGTYNSMIRRSSDNISLIWGLNPQGEFGDRTLLPSSRSKPVIAGSYFLIDQSNYNLFPSSMTGAPKLVDFSPFANEPYSMATSGGSVEFNGASDSATISTPFNIFNIGTNDACMEIWAYWNTFRTNTSYMTLFGQNSGNVSTIRIQSNYIGNDASVRYTINDDTPRGETAILVNTWYHLVVTITNGVARFFVNGVLRDYVTGIGPVIIRTNVVENTNQSFIIGTEDNGWFNGYLSNFRFCNGSIPTLYQTASSTINNTIFSVPTSPLTTSSQGATAANVVLLCFTGSNLIDQGNGITLTLQNTVAINSTGQMYGIGGLNGTGVLGDGSATARSSPVQIGSSPTFRSINGTFFAPTLINSGSWSSVSAGLSTSTALRNDNTLWVWGFNTSGQLGLDDVVSKRFLNERFSVSDVSTYASRIYRVGTGYTTSIIPFAGAVAGSFNVVGLDVNEYLYLENPSQLTIGTSNFTIEVWIYPTLYNNLAYQIINWSGSPNSSLSFYFSATQTVAQSISGPVPLLNTWTHVVFQKQTNVIRLFFDGVEVATPNTDTTNYLSNALRPEIGTGSGGSFFNGYMSNLRVVIGTSVYRPGITVPTSNLSIVPATLATNTLMLTCQSATIIDNSIYALTITVNGQSNVQPLSPFASPGYSVLFDGSGDWLQFALSGEFNLTNYTNYLVECWFYATALPAALKALVVAWPAVGSGPFYMGIDANNKMYIATGGINIAGSTTIVTNTWYHMCFIKNSSATVFGYLNGLTEIQSGGFTWASPGTVGVSIGGTTNGSNPFTGYISNVRIVKNILPYIASFPIPNSPLSTTVSAGNYTNQVTASQTVLLAYTSISSIALRSYLTASTKNTTHAITSDNNLYGTGINPNGQIGIAVVGNRSVPIQIGAIGQTINTYTNSPVQVTPGTSGYAQIWAGQSFSAARRTNNDVFTWGLGTSGQLGLGDAITRSSPTLMSSTQSWNQTVSVGYSHWVSVRYNKFDFLDSSTNNFTITQQGPNTEYSTTVIPFATAISVYQRLNDQGQLISAQTALSFSTGNFTIECWIFPTSVIGVFAGVVDARAAATASSWFFGLRNSASVYKVELYLAGIAQNTAATTIQLNVWTHIAATRNSGTVNIWVNGVSDLTGAGQTAAVNAGGTNQFVGRLIDTPAYAFPGYISNLRIVKGVAVYTGAFTVPTSPLDATQSSGVNINAITGTQTSLLTFRTEASSITWQANNKMYVQGGDGSGQLGISSGGTRTSFVLVGNGTTLNSGTLSPIQVGFGLPASWTSVSAGTSYSYARNNLGQVYVWGRNTSGVLATADTINRSSPTLLGASSVLVDQSQYTNSITNSAVVYTSVIVPFNGAVSGFFNGSATLFMVGNTNLDIGAAYTIEFWYYPTALTGTVLSYGVSGALQSYQILWQGGSLVFRGSGSPGGSYAGNTFAFIDSNLMTINQWYYVTVISQANNNKLCFLNGNFAYVGAAGINSYSVTSPNGLTIGEGLQGYISNLRITKTDVYSTSFTSPNSPLQTSGATFTSAQVGLLILTAPSNITGQPDFNLVSAGGTHVVTTNSTNWMYTLGLNSSGQIGDNTTIDRLSPVLIGNYFNTNTISPILAASASWSSVSSGTSYNLAINSNGTLWAWGLNNIGQLGSNDTINRSSIIQIGTSSFSLVRAGHSTSVAIDATSRLFAWGLGTSGQLDNNAVINRSSPIQIGTSSWTIVATGNTTVGGILIDGLLYVWGAAALGKTGTSTLINRSSPTIVQGINYETKSPTLVSEYWASISAGLSFTLGIANNSLYTWGLNSSGQLGLGDTINRSSPTLLGAAASITDGSVNNYTPSVQGAVSLNSTIIPFSNTASLYFNGSSYLNYSDAVNLQFGTGTFTIEMFIRTPTVGGIQRILSKGSNAGTGYTLGVSTSNFAFVLESTSYDHPTTLIANTWYHVAVTRDSADDLRLFVNGISSGILLNTNYDFNQTQNLFVGIARGAQTYPYTGYVSNLRIIKGTALYVSNFTVPTSPLTAIAGTQLLLASTTVPDLYGSTFAGSAASFAIKQDGTLFAWGLGTTGQTSGYWSAIDRSTPNQIGNNYISVNPSSPVLIASGSWSKVAAGNSVSAAIRNDGRLFTWGNLVSSGQLGDGTTISKSSPVAIGSSSWTQISAYDTHMMALTTTGQLFGWGLNASGQLGQINTINRSLPVQVGPTYFLTVKDSSTYNTNIQVFGTSYSTTVIPSLAGSVSGYFNGAGDYIQVPATTYNVNIGRSDFTIEFWINPTTMTNSTNIFTYGGYAESEGIGIDFLSNGIRAYLHNVNQSVVTPFMQTSTLTIGIWYHIACVRIGYNFYGYLNGVLQGSALTSTKVFTNDYALRIGCGDLFNATIDPAYYANFYISNFRLVIGVGIYTGNFTVPTSILTTTVSAGANIQAVTSSQTALLLYTTLAASLSNTSVVSWNSIGTGSSFTAAITASGRLYTWGFNSSGQLGLGNTINRSSPTQIGSASWISVASGGLGIESAIRNDGALFNWGLNGAYQLGNLWDTVNRSSPVQVGNNYAGQGTIFTRVPFKVNNLSWKQVSAGNSITSAISAQDRLFAWGLNTAGQVDQNSTTNRSDPTQVGSKQYLQTTAGASNVGAVGKAT